MSEIKITTKPMFMEEQSQSHADKFVYAYTIHIENNSSQTVQLLRREWKIIDEKDNIQRVEGEGVIGEQPHIEPGKDFSYTSGVILETETATMEGSYTMQRNDDSQFKVSIPMFALVPSKKIH